MLIILADGTRKCILGQVVCDSLKMLWIGTHLPLVGMSIKQPKSCFAVEKKPPFLVKQSITT